MEHISSPADVISSDVDFVFEPSWQYVEEMTLNIAELLPVATRRLQKIDAVCRQTCETGPWIGCLTLTETFVCLPFATHRNLIKAVVLGV